MTIQQTIVQLEDLIKDRQCFTDPSEHGVFDEDIKALGQAITFLQEMKLPVQHKDDLIRISLHYGIQNQLLKAIEEMGELQAAIIRFDQAHNIDGGEAFQNLMEEVADVYVMILQLRQLLSPRKIDAIAEQKIRRQLKRMEETS